MNRPRYGLHGLPPRALAILSLMLLLIPLQSSAESTLIYRLPYEDATEAELTFLEYAYDLPYAVADIDLNGDVVLPSVVEIKGHLYPLTSARYCFMGSGIKSIVIPSSIRELNDMFARCNELHTITLDGFKAIPERAFYYLHNNPEEPAESLEAFTTFIATKGLETIGRDAFRDCPALSTVILPEGVSRIGNGAFEGCTSLSSITLPEGLTIIDSGAFQNCTSLAYVSLPEGLVAIGDRAFDSCPQLHKVKLPSTLTLVEDWAFSDLYSVIVPPSVTECSPVAFADYGLIKAAYPEHLEINSFSSEYIRCPYPSDDFEMDNEFIWSKDHTVLYHVPYDLEGTYEIPYGVKTIASGAFGHCSKLTEITIPTSVERIEDYAFAYCTGLSSIGIPTSVKHIGKRAFYGCIGLRVFDIPETVTTLGNEIFGECSGLRKVSFRCFISSLPDGAFLNCENLEEIQFPDGVTAIGEYAFAGCESITQITIPETVTAIGYSAFSRSGLTSITIPESVTQLGRFLFNECSALESVHLPENIEAIPAATFYQCTALKNIIIPESVKTIGEQAFYHCDALASIRIPDTVTSIDGKAFRFCGSLSEVILPSRITKILYYTFAYCTSLKTITIPNSVTSIHRYAFEGCSALCEVKLSGSLQEIWYSAFEDCAIKEICIPSGVITIGMEAFKGNPLEKIHIGHGIETIEADAFKGTASSPSIFITASNPPATEGTPFADCNGTLHLIPDAVESYRQSENCWNQFEISPMIEPQSVTIIEEDSPAAFRVKSSFKKKFSVSILPENTSITQVFWTSDNPEIATVSDDGAVTISPDAEGIATISAHTLFADHIANVMVSAGQITGIENVRTESDASQNSRSGIYSLTGRLIKTKSGDDEIKKLPAGIYIVNGKKTLVK